MRANYRATQDAHAITQGRAGARTQWNRSALVHQTSYVTSAMSSPGCEYSYDSEDYPALPCACCDWNGVAITSIAIGSPVHRTNGIKGCHDAWARAMLHCKPWKMRS